MTARSVYWQDGMFMWPHHMQQEVRFQAERLRVGHRWDVQHNWGLRTLEIDADALKTGRLVIRNLQARLRDGTLVDVPAEGRLPSLDLTEILQGKDGTTIFLGVPKLQPHRANITQPATAVPGNVPAPETRYLIESVEIEDENSGEDPQALVFRALNLKLLPDAGDLAGYDVLPIARFEKIPTGEVGLQLDPVYIPPILACDAWKPLAVDILQYLFHRLSARQVSLANQILSRGITHETHNPGDNVLLGQLAVLNEASAVLNTIAFAEGIHPLPAYLELCRIVGQLAVFTKSARTPELPKYDHDDLGNCFHRVKRYLEALEPAQAAYEEREFIGEKLRMQVAMEAKWLEPAWQFFVGAQSPLPQDQVIKLLTKPEMGLDMKIGSGERVDHIFERGRKGLEFTHTPTPPRVLPARPGLVFFQVNRESQKSEWDEVQKSLTLAIRLNQNRIAVSPKGDIQGQQTITFKLGSQAAATMQFSLFLVQGDGSPPQ